MSWYENRQDLFYNEQRAIEEAYPSLHFGIRDGKMYLSGTLFFRGVYNNEVIEDCYEVDIQFPNDYPDDLPIVWEVGGKIAKGYHHFSDETLCLGTLIEINKIFHAAPNINNFIESLLIPYLYRHSYLKKFKKAPFADSAHGVLGIVQWHQTYFELDDPRKILQLLSIIIEGKYRGHLRCPCGSKKKLRKCHGPKLIQLFDVPKKYVQLEASSILAYVLELNQRLRDHNRLEMLGKIQTT